MGSVSSDSSIVAERLSGLSGVTNVMDGFMLEGIASKWNGEDGRRSKSCRFQPGETASHLEVLSHYEAHFLSFLTLST
jgi:hypothetical protein